MRDAGFMMMFCVVRHVDLPVLVSIILRMTYGIMGPAAPTPIGTSD
jgi:hypothetical protein